MKAAVEKSDSLSGEQRKHLRRMARLERLLKLAVEIENDELRKQVEALKIKESSRYMKAIAKLAMETPSNKGERRDSK